MEVGTDTAGWYHTGLPPVPVRWVLSRDPQDECEPQALLATHLAYTPTQILEWFVRRWTLEVTFEEARAHLGLETQQQWQDWAIGRTTPALFGWYSLVTLMAHAVLQAETRVVRTAAWYANSRPPFVDAMALVRRELWSACHFAMSEPHSAIIKLPRSLFERFTETVCYAA